ncbi:MAG TPA: protein tyrosine phosphatase family protein [Burkholderiales bacterium]|nr:protein tyrosine phosphatase family protein [Burkholderiales bacterium]
MEEAQVSDIYNYRAVDALLSTSGQPTEDELRVVAREGFEVVINLALHDDPRYSLRDETGLVQSLGIRYVHIPVQFAAPTEADLDAFFAAMEQHRGRKILVHCAANKRVTAFLGLYRVIRQGWREEDAFALMHSVWQPDAVWSPFIAAMLERPRG